MTIMTENILTHELYIKLSRILAKYCVSLEEKKALCMRIESVNAMSPEKDYQAKLEWLGVQNLDDEVSRLKASRVG